MTLLAWLLAPLNTWDLNDLVHYANWLKGQGNREKQLAQFLDRAVIVQAKLQGQSRPEFETKHFR